MAVKNPTGSARTREGQSKHIEREYEIGKDEAWFSNVKRTYDEFLQESLTEMRHNRIHFDKLISDAQALTTQLMQNAVENMNFASKNVLKHGEFATDRIWAGTDVSQGAEDVLTARAVSIDDASLKAIGAVVAAAVAEALKD